LLNFIL